MMEVMNFVFFMARFVVRLVGSGVIRAADGGFLR